MSRPPQSSTNRETLVAEEKLGCVLTTPQADVNVRANHAVDSLRDTLTRMLPHDGDVDAYAMALRSALSAFSPYSSVLQVELALIQRSQQIASERITRG